MERWTRCMIFVLHISSMCALTSLGFPFRTGALGLDRWLPVTSRSCSSFPCSIGRGEEESCCCQERIRSINTWRCEQKKKLWFIEGDFFYTLESMVLKRKIVPVLIHMECRLRAQVYLDSFDSVPWMRVSTWNPKSFFELLLTCTFLHCCCTERSWLFSTLACWNTKSRVSALKAKHTANLRQAYEGTWLEWRLFSGCLFLN